MMEEAMASVESSDAWGELRCAYCGRTPDQVLALLKGATGLRICDLCIGQARETLTGE